LKFIDLPVLTDGLTNIPRLQTLRLRAAGENDELLIYESARAKILVLLLDTTISLAILPVFDL